MDLKIYISLACVVLLASTGLLGTATQDVDKLKRFEASNIRDVVMDKDDSREINKTSAKLAVSNRLDAESRRVNPFRLLMGKPRVSPLYLINGTVCRFVNYQPICTTLSTTGFSVGSSSSGGAGGSRPSSGGGGGSGSSGSRPAGGGGSSGGGSGGGSSGGSGGSGSRPSSAGLMSGGSSVQFANSPDMFVERLDNLTDTSNAEQHIQQAELRPLSVIVSPNRQRLSLFRRPMRYQLVTNRQEDIMREERNQPSKSKRNMDGHQKV